MVEKKRLVIVDQNGNIVKGRFEQSPDTKVLIERMREMAEGDILEYSELTKKIGRDVQNEARSNLDAARNYLWRNDHMFFDCVHGVGVKRVTTDGWVEVVKGHEDSITRKERKLIKKLEVVDHQTLSQVKRMDALMLEAKLRAKVLFSSRKYEERLLEETKKRGEAPKLTISVDFLHACQ
jgi:hypothetical protein